MFQLFADFPGRDSFAGILALLVSLGFVWYCLLRRKVSSDRYNPRLAWVRAGLYFGLCLIIASFSGVIAKLSAGSWLEPGQVSDPVWWVSTILCFAVIFVAYAVIWPKGTFTDGRKNRPFLTITYGAVWGLCQGLLFLSVWALVEASGLAVYWVAIISYFLIGAYNGCLHNFFWDIYVSPPHNYSEWNTKKVLYCHTPNLMFTLSWLAMYGNAGLFVLLQSVALAASSYAMRFPAFWDDYDAVAGQERSLA